MFDIEIDLSDVRRQFDAVGREIGVASQDLALDCAQQGAQEAKDSHGYTDRTGDLTGSIDWKPISASPTSVQVDIVAGGGAAPYARIIEQGSRPHQITGNPLAFEAGGRTVFTRRVSHPGTRAYGFMGVAYQKAARVAVVGFDKLVARLRAKFT